MAVPKKISFFLVLVLAWGFWGSQAKAASPKKHVQATLISEVSSIAPGQPFWIALQMKMDPGWHTYWANPGDSGLATRLNWTFPKGFTTGPIQWPYPEKILIDSLVNYGYEGEIYLLQEITPPRDLPLGGNVVLPLNAKWLVCQEACVPEGADLQLTLLVQKDGGKTDPAQAAAFARARGVLPAPEGKIGITEKVAGEKLLLSVQTALPAGEVYFFAETPGQISPSGLQTLKKTGNGFDLEATLEPGTDRSEGPIRGILFAASGFAELQGGKAVQVGTAEKQAGTKTVTVREWKWSSLLPAIFSALLGGMILNLMPCVFPVLSIKVLGFVRQSETQPGEVKRQGLLFGAGVLSSFLILATLLLSLRAGGEELGWGFQLQSPLFVGGLAVLFFAIALNLLGVFEFGTSVMGLAAGHGQGGGRWESFFSGVLATLVATPCTAPFMGSALGFALSQPAIGALMIFTGLGIGMALPYVLLSFFPQLGRYLPKPGAWMESFKQCMAFPLFATVIWLLWILGLQVDTDGVTALLITLLAVALAAWIYGRWGNPLRSEGVRWATRVIALVLVLLGLVYARDNLKIPSATSSGEEKKTDKYGLVWETYSPERIAALQMEGRPIYLDFTAAWCATCQVNKKLVFGSEEVRNRLKELNVALVRGDWTRNDPVITQALQSFDRAGVPLNVIYGKGPDAKPIVLPEVLTAGMVLDTLKGL